MPVSASQQAAFTSASLGVPMSSFNLTILLILYSILYIWMSWVIVTQWKAWSNRKINFYDFLTRTVRTIFLTLVFGFLLP